MAAVGIMNFLKIQMKISFRKFNSSDILSVDDTNFLKSIVSGEFINPRILYIRYLPFTIFDFKKKYFTKILRAIRPKSVVLHDYISRRFLDCINSEHITSIVYQHNYIRIAQAASFQGFTSNYYLVHNKYQYELLKSKVNSNIKISGSVQGNQLVKKKSDLEFDVLFISEYRNLNNKHHLFQLNVFNSLVQYCRFNKLKLGVAYNSTRRVKKLKIEDEIDFLSSGDIDASLKGSYEKASSSNVVVTMHSNLGQELLSHGYKVCFCSMFEYPFPVFETKIGPFWSSISNVSKLPSQLDWMLGMSDAEWIDYIKANHADLLTGDRANKVFWRVVGYSHRLVYK